MSTYVSDAGSRYIVKDENLEAAFEWLDSEGEYAKEIGHVDGCTWLGPDGDEEMWCGNVAYSFDEGVMEFMREFCEVGSFACFRLDDHYEYLLVMKDEDGVSETAEYCGNPFDGKMEELMTRY